ncbi:MAG: ParA family protein [Desulfovibrionales bacterium]|nr:ParA family protein [Desulfovibrionales bacterium]
MSNVLTISGHRSGVGKSVVALNLATALAVYEKKTLLIDCNPQREITSWSGMIPPDLGQDLSTVMGGWSSLEAAVVDTPLAYLDMIPAGTQLLSQSRKLSVKTANEKLLRLLLEEGGAGEYDYVIFDAPVSNRYLTLAAMTAADWLVPVLSPRLSCEDDVTELIDDIRYVRKTHGTALKIAGFVFNRCHGRSEILSFLVRESLSNISDLIYDQYIPEHSVVQASI